MNYFKKIVCYELFQKKQCVMNYFKKMSVL